MSNLVVGRCVHCGRKGLKIRESTRICGTCERAVARQKILEKGKKAGPGVKADCSSCSLAARPGWDEERCRRTCIMGLPIGSERGALAHHDESIAKGKRALWK